jgi:hypothetical protein
MAHVLDLGIYSIAMLRFMTQKQRPLGTKQFVSDAIKKLFFCSIYVLPFIFWVWIIFLMVLSAGWSFGLKYPDISALNNLIFGLYWPDSVSKHGFQDNASL